MVKKALAFCTPALVFVLTLTISSASAQKYEKYVADDGTEVDLAIISVNPDKAPKIHIGLGAFGIEGIKLVNLSYYEPKKFMVNTYIGTNSYLIDGNYFLSSNLKTKKWKQSVQSGIDSARARPIAYMLRFDTKVRRSWGIHAGVSGADYSNDITNINAAPFAAIGVFIGGTFLRSSYVNFSIKNKYKVRKGHYISRIHADIIAYVSRTPNQDALEDNATIDDISRPIGFRAYYEGVTAFWSKSGRFTFHYQAGVALHASKEVTFPGFLGFGLGYAI